MRRIFVIRVEWNGNEIVVGENVGGREDGQETRRERENDSKLWNENGTESFQHHLTLVLFSLCVWVYVSICRGFGQLKREKWQIIIFDVCWIIHSHNSIAACLSLLFFFIIVFLCVCVCVDLCLARLVIVWYVFWIVRDSQRLSIVRLPHSTTIITNSNMEHSQYLFVVGISFRYLLFVPWCGTLVVAVRPAAAVASLTFALLRCMSTWCFNICWFVGLSIEVVYLSFAMFVVVVLCLVPSSLFTHIRCWSDFRSTFHTHTTHTQTHSTAHIFPKPTRKNILYISISFRMIFVLFGPFGWSIFVGAILFRGIWRFSLCCLDFATQNVLFIVRSGKLFRCVVSIGPVNWRQRDCHFWQM